jgi:asparagine synthase (glutamine-hydrolysing)
MCGLIGAIGEVNWNHFIKALDVIHHRGPDGRGIYLYDYTNNEESCSPVSELYSNALAFGHNRLKIIDLSDNANQPMVKHGLTLVFNGEIYNHKELRVELESYGYVFETDCDSEVLLSGYDYWGESCVEKFNGMWAFSIFDKAQNKCFLSRDRMGVKPLYYYEDENNFYFASEIKSIIEFKVPLVGDKEELLRFLIYGAKESGKKTTFINILRFPSGHNGIYDVENRKLSTYKYFDLNSNLNVDLKFNNENDLIKEVKSQVDKSIDLRLRSDVPIGMALSGGVDSNIIVYEVNQKNRNIETFSSVYSENEEINETNNIQLTLDNLKLDGNFITVTKFDVLNSIERIVWYQDEPFDTLGILAQNKVYDLMYKRSVKVSLDGQGADEIFAGYPFYIAIFLRENMFKFSLFKDFIKCNLVTLSNIKLLILSFFPDLFERLYFRKRAKKFFRNKINFIRSEKEGFSYFKGLNTKLVYDTKEHLQVLLRYVDRNSMQYSVESRGVFLDYNLVCSALKIPSQYKIKNCYSKYILRKAYSNVVPNEIIWNKKKMGFPVPQAEWLNDQKIIEKLNGYIDDSLVIKALGIDKIPMDDHNAYWRLANVAIWGHVFKIKHVL